MENETRRLIGWLPGEPGGRLEGPGAPPVGPRERERKKKVGASILAELAANTSDVKMRLGFLPASSSNK